ncbi:mitogen-activated protein kinase kinase kinase 5-like isoform X2 [Ptychodera flava]|uniref:mitogen-activated protein kinase kinase kinase 5-like isoform X2 n=1 Tax=Ptychodera flava TaxID=63121 RepID=UPI00396A1564
MASKGTSKNRSIKVVLVQSTPNSATSQNVFRELSDACSKTAGKFTLERIAFEHLDFGETTVLDMFYLADVAFVDMSVFSHQSPLFYHLGVRESFGRKDNVVLYHHMDAEMMLSLKKSCISSGYDFIPYQTDTSGKVYVCDLACIRVPAEMQDDATVDLPTRVCPPLNVRFKTKLDDIQVISSINAKEVLLNDIRKAREKYLGEDLARELKILKNRMDEQLLLTSDIVHQFLLSYREIQDYDSMVSLVEAIKDLPHDNITQKSAIDYLYTFALNRRNRNGDRQKALKAITCALEKKENQVPDVFCLCGRIYKDQFTESNYEDTQARDNAIYWYRKGFEVQPNEYAGINLATLLVLSGKEFSKCPELQRIGVTLNNLIGRKGSLESLQDYWDIATFFEISVLAQDYNKAVQASECMFKLKPPEWYLKSTLGNIQMIVSVQKLSEEPDTPELQLFHFWLDFFVEATKPEISDVRFPVLVLEPTKEFMPSYVTINKDAEEKNVRLWHVAYDDSKAMKIHEWLFEASSIKGVSLYKRDDRCLFLYVQQNADDFQIYFSSERQRKWFYELIVSITDDKDRFAVADPESDLSLEPVQYEYEVGENGQRVVLGRGTYGTVYAARDLNTQVGIAVKEVPERDKSEVQPLHEEIRLHMRLSHKNIVKYLGSASDGGFFKIFMEQVPGGSLSALLRSKWGPLKDHEQTIAFYTKQVVEGLKYLHDQKIVHRDIKGDNVLVNTYSGQIKISDFGTSKRLSGINPAADSFKGTLQYMAPEVIDKGIRGYGAPADIWSLGCTVVEMATGKPPFIELGSPQAAMFKVGYYKMHPTIPDSMSERAKDFIERCFEPDPEKRCTANELLKHSFLTKTKSKPKQATADDQLHPHLGRSVSVPVTVVVPSRTHRSPSSPNTLSSTADDDLRDWDDMVTNMDAILEMGSADTAPTELLHVDRQVSRLSDASGTTPETPITPGTKDGFYMLRKDSERRGTLIQVLTDDQDSLIEAWYGRVLRESASPIKLDKKHFMELLNSLRSYIQTQEKDAMHKSLCEMKQELAVDADAVNELQLILYVFQDCVNEILRRHSVKPHWMFALDNIVRTTVHEVISYLTPEVEIDFSEVHGQDEVPAANSSGVSTLSSNREHDRERFHESKTKTSLKAQIRELSQENTRLMQEYISFQRDYQDMLRLHIQEKRQLLEQLRQQSTPALTQETQTSQADTATASYSWKRSACEPRADKALIEWLESLGLDKNSIQKFIKEEYTLNDVLQLMSKEDLTQLELRGSARVRVWDAIQKYRSAMSSSTDKGQDIGYHSKSS